jgi:hypothetical protein
VHPLELPTQQKMSTEDLGVDGKIHLRIIFKKYAGCFYAVFTRFRTVTSGGICEQLTELPCFIRGGDLSSQGDRCSCHCWDFTCLHEKSKQDEKRENATRYEGKKFATMIHIVHLNKI